MKKLECTVDIASIGSLEIEYKTYISSEKMCTIVAVSNHTEKDCTKLDVVNLSNEMPKFRNRNGSFI